MPGKIFISYRRDDDPAFAARVRDGLAARFGKNYLFMDVDNLLAGLRFDEELAAALSACDVFIAIIGARWMDLLRAKAAHGERDYVREEISAALKRKVMVIPVRVGRDGQLAPLPNAADLPPAIADLVLYQKHDVSHENFGRDVGALADAITAVRRRAGGQAGRESRGAVLGWTGAALVGMGALGGAWTYYASLPLPWSSPTSVVAPQPNPPASKIIQADAPKQATIPPDHPKQDAKASPAPAVRKSPANGGTGGDPFDDSDANPGYLPITGLDVTEARNPANPNEKIIGRLVVHWGDVVGPSRGGGWPGAASAKATQIRFAKGEAVTMIVVIRRTYTWAADEKAPVWVTGLRVQTNKNIYNFGDTDVSGGRIPCVPASGEQIVGFVGRSGSFIDELGCVFAPEESQRSNGSRSMGSKIKGIY